MRKKSVFFRPILLHTRILGLVQVASSHIVQQIPNVKKGAVLQHLSVAFSAGEERPALSIKIAHINAIQFPKNVSRAYRLENRVIPQNLLQAR